MTLEEEVENLKRQLREVVRDRFDTLNRAQMMVIQIGNDLEDAERDLEEAAKERDELKAEVEQLRAELEGEWLKRSKALEEDGARLLAGLAASSHSRLRAVAEDQREACAQTVLALMWDAARFSAKSGEDEWLSRYHPEHSDLIQKLRATPLVTEGEP